MSWRKRVALFLAYFVADFLVETYYFSLTQRWMTTTLTLAGILPWVNTLTALVLIDAKTRRERIEMAAVASAALLASTACLLWLVS